MISLIAAASENNVIGVNNSLPWYLPDDLQYFKKVTERHPVIMGWNNYKSMGRALPNRLNVVISWHPEEKIDGCEVVGSLEEAIEVAKRVTLSLPKGDTSDDVVSRQARDDKTGDDPEIFIIGGGMTYAEALPQADKIYLTRVYTKIEGDVFFPEFDLNEWKLISEEKHEADERHKYAFIFLVYERKV